MNCEQLYFDWNRLWKLNAAAFKDFQTYFYCSYPDFLNLSETKKNIFNQHYGQLGFCLINYFYKERKQTIKPPLTVMVKVYWCCWVVEEKIKWKVFNEFENWGSQAHDIDSKHVHSPNSE